MKVLLLILLICLPLNASAEWNYYPFERPTTRTDGTPLPFKELKGYKLYLDEKEYERAAYLQWALGGNYFSRWGQYIIADIPDTVKKLEINTIDTGGRESPYYTIKP